MNCTQIEKLIPLYVGEDLKPREAGQVRRHLESCPNCRQLTTEFEESRNWLRHFATPQFDETIFDGLRDALHQEIAPMQPRSSWLPRFDWLAPAQFMPAWNRRVVLAGSIALLILVSGFVIYLSRREGSNQPNQANRKMATTDSTPGPRNQPEKTGQPGQDDAAAINSRSVRKRPIAGRFAAKARPTALPPVQTDDLVSVTASQLTDLISSTIESPIEPPVNNDGNDLDVERDRDMLRIEIQTADPKIRIIWFAPKVDSSSGSEIHMK